MQREEGEEEGGKAGGIQQSSVPVRSSPAAA